MYWQISKSDSFDLDGSYTLHRGSFVLCYGTLDECHAYYCATLIG